MDDKGETSVFCFTLAIQELHMAHWCYDVRGHGVQDRMSRQNLCDIYRTIPWQ